MRSAAQKQRALMGAVAAHAQELEEEQRQGREVEADGGTRRLPHWGATQPRPFEAGALGALACAATAELAQEPAEATPPPKEARAAGDGQVRLLPCPPEVLLCARTSCTHC